MKNSKTLFQEIISRIRLEETPDEIESIVLILLADLFSLTRTAIMTGTEISWSVDDAGKIDEAIRRINEHEPVQYVAGSALFWGRKFFVDPTVLIPRPETEELVAHVLDHARQQKMPLRLLDIGTGTGCIPVTLAAELPGAEVMATDISENALAVARRNVVLHKVEVRLLLHDILTKSLPFERLDIVVSNPPYIPASEIAQMQRNVADYEPHLALFVPDDDPLLFYRAIALRSGEVLAPGGTLFLEVHDRFASDVARELDVWGYGDIRTEKDLSDKHRVVKAVLKT